MINGSHPKNKIIEENYHIENHLDFDQYQEINSPNNLYQSYKSLNNHGALK